MNEIICQVIKRKGPSLLLTLLPVKEQGVLKKKESRADLPPFLFFP